MDIDPAFTTFVGKWIGTTRPSSVATQALARIEEQLSLTLPSAYRSFVGTHGTPSTHIGLLNSIVEGQHDVHDVHDFIPLEELVEATSMYEAAGMDPGFLGFATDCMGNMFLFKRSDCLPGAQDAPVWFFDHEFVSIDQEAASFAEWIERLAGIEVVA